MRRFATVVPLLLLVMPTSSLAHHSRAEFVDETTELVGVVTNVIWRNPHYAIFLDVETEGGIEQWRVESFGAPGGSEGAGLTRDHFVLGERITLAGRVSSARPNYILGTNALLADGTEAILGSIYQPRWSTPIVVGGRSGSARRSRQVVDAASENLGIFRIWNPPGRTSATEAPGRFRDLPFTDEAIAARADWDPVDNPVTRCEQPGMPVPVVQPVYFRILEDGENIVFHYSFFDTQRTIHMDPDLNADDFPPSHLGISKGVWENDNTLYIETSRVNYPYYSLNGTPQSESVLITERYTLSEDQTRLDLYMTVDDPVTFTRAATYQWYFLALGRRWALYECNVF